MVNSIPAREIKRRGIGAVDEALKKGPVHIIKNDEPRYVVMDAAQFQEWLDERQEAYVAQVTESLEDVKAGRVRYFATAKEVLTDIEGAITEDRHATHRVGQSDGRSIAEDTYGAVSGGSGWDLKALRRAFEEDQGQVAARRRQRHTL